MKCYNHHDRDAFAVCKSCGKALCLECAEDYKGFYICRGSDKCKHIADVDYVNYFKDNSEDSWRFNRIALLSLGILVLLYILGKLFFLCIFTCPFLEKVILILVALFLIKKGVEFKLR